jgi:hypothetical protein
MTTPTQIQTIPADRLCSLTGLTDRRHRQLAKQGFFPPPVAGDYQLNATIGGLFKYFREEGQNKDQLRLAQTRKEKALATKLERQNRLAMREICEWEDVLKILNQYFINPMVQALDAAPRDLDQQWVDRTLKPLLRQKLDELKPKSPATQSPA